MLSLLFMAFLAQAQTPPSFLIYSSGVPWEQKQLLEKDLQVLQTGNFANSDGEFSRILKMPLLDSSSLQAWLQERVKYVVQANHPFDASALISLAENVEYPFPLQTPQSDALDAQDLASSVVMSNMGGLIYKLGKENRVLVGFNMQGFGIIPVHGPRVGILRIGPALFEPLTKQTSPESVGNRLHSLYRLSTLMHEARHSDGHGQSLNFPHVLCPAGHDYAGAAGCDAPANGSYRIGALFLRSALEGCADCSVGEKEILSLLILDAENRILSPLADGQVSRAKSAVVSGKLCRQLQSANIHAPFCEQKLESEQKVEWEDAPESL